MVIIACHVYGTVAFFLRDVDKRWVIPKGGTSISGGQEGLGPHIEQRLCSEPTEVLAQTPTEMSND